MKYKIIIEEIMEKEYPEKRYGDTGKNDANGEKIYDYLETGEIRIQRDAKEIFVQEKEDLNIEELAVYINSK